MRDAHNPGLFLFRLLLVCALVTLHAPVAQPPILRTRSLPNPSCEAITNTTTTESIDKVDTTNLLDVPCSDPPRDMSKARVYADVNVVRPKEYWDYESLTVQWG